MIKTFTKTSDFFKSIRFCAVAAKRKDDGFSFSLTHMKVDNGLMTATDGRRLHQAIIGNALDDGFYSIKKLNKGKIELQLNPTFNSTNEWPNTEPITTKSYASVDPVLLDNTEDSFIGLDESSNIAKIYRAMDDDRVLQHGYINDATNGQEMQAFISDKDSPVKLADSSGHSAWIMPALV